MHANQNKCSKCMQCNAVRKCDDCINPNNEFCENCFQKNHTGKSTRNHISRLIKYNAIIKDRSFKFDESNLDSCNDFFSIPNESDNELDTSSNKSSSKMSINLSNCAITDKISESAVVENSHNSYETLPEGPCILFESDTIKSFESVNNLAQALQIKELTKNVNFQVVTFIGKPIDDEPVPNLLLLTDNDMKFIKGTNITKSPLCIMIYDFKNQLLVLETQNMYEQNEMYTDNQINLMNLLLALSDVIVFSENSRRPDFIRIHEMMKTCKDRFGSHFRKIYKFQPERLAPGLIYLQLKDSHFTDDLPTSIKNNTGRSDLFASLTKIIFVKDVKNINKEFVCDLKEVLGNLSKHRTRHSLEDFLLCINNCKEPLSDNNDIPDSWFFCHTLCEICEKICERSFGHSGSHYSEDNCLSTPDNEVYFCKKCKDKGERKHILPLVLKPMSKNEGFLKNIFSYPIRGRIVECEKHGIIMDKNWLITYYQDTTCSKYLHKWPGESLISQNVYPVGQILIDKFKQISEPAAKIVVKSTEYVSDVVKPDDWQSTRGTSCCSCCNEHFTVRMSKHHCRKCKSVICSSCLVPNQSSPVCIKCQSSDSCGNNSEEPRGITFLNYFRDTFNASNTYLRRTVSSFNRPDYWENDDTVIHCFICVNKFNFELNPIHHCRACGKCVCDKCSLSQKTVEWRCITDPSRICDLCIKNQFWKKAP